ncbi:hypothetical protein [Streptomyces fulvoviolaceus]|uniref:hypothetical protein n=1 Tax=Streptomyces fulvoviolaceus TaxID=285535 RepID=UPI0004C4C1DC|nr:hypothetical protein [Streptomyces fulvoviolaceus]
MAARLLNWFRSQDTAVKAALIGLTGTLTAALITATVTLTIALSRPATGTDAGGRTTTPTPSTPAPDTSFPDDPTSTTPPATASPPPTTTPPPSPPEPSPTPPPASPVAESRVRWHGTLELNGDTMTRGWWLDQTPPGSAVNGDVYTEGAGVLYSDAALVAWRDSGAPTHDRCATLLNANRGLHTLDVQVGDRACVGTWDGRVGYVEVTSVPDAERIDVTATVWERQ